jgi:simple sugar transport system substrate-binding protein
MLKNVALIWLLCFLLGCNNSKSNKTRDNQRIFLVSHAGAGDFFWNVVFTGAKRAASDIDVNLQIVAPETPNDIARQVELLNAAIASKPQGIILSIADDHAFSGSLKEAQAQGIAVVAINSRPKNGPSKDNPYLAFVGMDDYAAGKGIATKAWSGGQIKNRAMIAIHQAGHIGLEQRALGIKEILEPFGIIVDKLDISCDASQALQIIKGYMSKYKDCSTVFLVGAFGAHAVGRWFKTEHPNVLLTSFDLTPLTIELLKDTSLAYSVDQQPFMQGYMAVVEMGLYARYALHPADLNTGLGLVNSEQAKIIDGLVSLGVR